ncbi:hypothetical protein Trydic_g6361 [Trypoxylus dichotomus]
MVRLWDDEKQKIIFARDVVFKETRNTDTPRKEIGLRWLINDAHYEENKNEIETLDENSIEQDQEKDEDLIQDNEENSQKVEEQMQSKRSERTKKLPKYLEAYELDVENISCMTYEEAVTGQNRHEWLQAVEEEKISLIENNTCEQVNRQEAGEAKILNKCVLRIKNDGRYKARLVIKHRMRDSKPVETSIAGITKIADDEHDELRFPYRKVIGSLLYASCKTRPDLAYAVNYESRFVENPKKLDVTNVKRTLRYLNGSTSGRIKYMSGADTELLEAFCDSDFAGCEDTRRSTSGYVIMFCEHSTKELMYLKCLYSALVDLCIRVIPSLRSGAVVVVETQRDEIGSQRNTAFSSKQGGGLCERRSLSSK